FRRGTILTARFASDGKTVVYGAAWDGNKPEVFLVTADSPESRPLGLANTDVYAVSSSGELALSLRNRDPLPPVSGTLERAALLGGAAPRPVMDGVEFADWGENGSLAVTLDTGVGDRLEYPVGTSLYEKEGPIHDIRLAPDLKLVAFWEVEKGAFVISVVDRQHRRRILSPGMLRIQGLAWTPSVTRSGLLHRRPTRTGACTAFPFPANSDWSCASPVPLACTTFPMRGRCCWPRRTVKPASAILRGPGWNAISPGSMAPCWGTSPTTAARCCSARSRRRAAPKVPFICARPMVLPRFVWATGWDSVFPRMASGPLP